MTVRPRMDRTEPAKTMVCVDCLMKIKATLNQAKRHGWRIWVGGSRCKACGQKLDAALAGAAKGEEG